MGVRTVPRGDKIGIPGARVGGAVKKSGNIERAHFLRNYTIQPSLLESANRYLPANSCGLFHAPLVLDRREYMCLL